MTTKFGRANVLGTFEIHSPEWHEARKLGASSLAVLVCHEIADSNPDFPRPNKSRWDIWMECLGEASESSRSEEQERALRLGNILEPIVLEEYRIKFGGHVTPYKASLCDPDKPFLTCNLDGVKWTDERELAAEILLEVKRYHSSQKKIWESEGVPLVIKAQNLSQQSITGVHCGQVVALFENSLAAFPVSWDRQDAEFIRETGERFWLEHVETRTPPEIDGSGACAEWILRKWAVGAGTTINLDAAAEEWVDCYQRAHEDEKDATARKDEARNHLLEIMGEAKKGVYSGGSVARTRPNYFDAQAFQADHPELYEDYRNFVFDEREFRAHHPHLYEIYKIVPGAGSVRVYPKRSK